MFRLKTNLMKTFLPVKKSLEKMENLANDNADSHSHTHTYNHSPIINIVVEYIHSKKSLMFISHLKFHSLSFSITFPLLKEKKTVSMKIFPLPKVTMRN